jgi:hypothetical protein
MIEKFATAAKQTGLELISMSEAAAGQMQTWDDILVQNPESITATFSAGFINKPSVPSKLEMVIDVQAPLNEKTVLRTWAIATTTGDDQKEYFNSIQLTFEADSQQVQNLITEGKTVTREDIRLLLQSQTTRLATITVSNHTGGDRAKQTDGERYDFTVAELAQSSDNIARVSQAMQTVLQTLKQPLA